MVKDFDVHCEIGDEDWVFDSIANHLFRFAQENVSQAKFLEVNGQEREAIHTLATTINLTSETINRNGKRKADVLVTKPNGWEKEYNDISVIEAQVRKRVVPCELCHKELHYHEAFCTWRGWGPCCLKCIDEDEHLRAYKWEPM